MDASKLDKADMTLKKNNIQLTEVDQFTPIITFEDKTGCPKVGLTAAMQFLSNNPWIMGIFLIVFGGLNMVFGSKFFPKLMAVLVGLIVLVLVI